MSDLGKLERDTTFIKAAEALAGEIIYEATDANGVKVEDLEGLLRRRLYDFAFYVTGKVINRPTYGVEHLLRLYVDDFETWPKEE